MRELRERAEPILRIVVLILAAVLVYQLAGIFVRWNPFRGVTVPELPTLAAGTNAPAGKGNSTNLAAAATGKSTNVAARSAGSNAVAAAIVNRNSNSQTPAALNATNSIVATNLAAVRTNAATETRKTTTTNIETKIAERLEIKSSETNSTKATNTAGTGTNLLLSAATTNPAPPATSAETNFAVRMPATGTDAGTQAVARLAAKLSGTNLAAATNVTNGTNVALTATGTNAPPRTKPEKKPGGPPPEMAGMNFNPFGPPGKSAVELPAAVKARISKITDSEILGPVIRPLPQALLGIAGNVAFLRSAKGQTGLVKEGDSLDDIKLLRIGINRVLIEQDGEKKELTIFDGYGGSSLLQNNSTNENNPPK